ncbi:MAG: hypothetical protein U0X91_27635 [Spirosomataceae bacterium]
MEHISEELFNQIHAYLRGEGSPEERTAFEQQMNQNPELTQEVASQKRIKTGLKANENKRKFQDIHAQLKAAGALPQVVVQPTLIEEEIEEQAAVKVTPLWSWGRLAIAASVMLAVSVGWYIYSNSEPTQPEVAVTPEPPNNKPDTVSPKQETVNPKPETVNPKPEPPNFKQLFAQNFSASPKIGSPFSSENFGVSPSLVARWQADTATLHAGIRLLDAGLGRSALAELEKLEKSKFEEIQQHAQWYIALSLLWQNQYEKTKERLDAIVANDKHLYQARAKRLLEKIKPNA